MEDSYVQVSSNEISNKPIKIEPQKDDIGNNGGSSPNSRSSPEANCPICLCKPENKSFTDSCLHQFCFKCLLEWSKVKAVCPLCKQSFKSIIHNVRSIEDYEQYYLSTTSPESTMLGIFARLETDQPREPFRYRTTAVSSYLDYFVRLEEAISHVIPAMPVPRSTHISTTHWQRRRQFGTSDFRRNIYQQGLWVQRLPDVTGRVRDCSPEFYRANPTLVHRLVPWLNRELNVVCGINQAHVQSVMSRILELVTQFPIRSPEFAAAIAPFIGRNTEHFVHEFYSFASSPYDLIGYDRHAHYVTQATLAHEIPSDHSDSGADSDVQVVGLYPPTSSQPAIQLMDSDSDDCVVVDNVPAPPPALSPEVITLESDDDLVQVNIQIGSSTPAETCRPGPSRRPSLKRSWVTNVQVPTSNDNLNVSINIAHASRSQTQSSSSVSSSSSLSSSSSWSPPRKLAKTKEKKRKSAIREKTVKGKSLINTKNKSNKKKSSIGNRKKTCDRSASPVVHEKKRKPPLIHESDSDNDSSALHIDTDQSLMSSSDESEYKPRVRSVVFKSTAKTESVSPQASPNCVMTGSRTKSLEKYFKHTSQSYSIFDPDIPESSRLSNLNRCENGYSSSSDSSSSNRQSWRKCKHSKKRSRDRF